MFLTMLAFLAVGLLSAATAKSYGQGLLKGFVVLIVCYAVGFAIEYAGSTTALDLLSPNRWFNVKAVRRRPRHPIRPARCRCSGRRSMVDPALLQAA
jgi:hypothetical protein